MSIVIIGGNERMVARYENLCQDYGCKAKVFVKEHGSIKKKMGCPDLLLLFTNTVSHKMVMNASQEAKRNNIPIVRIQKQYGGSSVCSGRNQRRTGKCWMNFLSDTALPH